MTSTRPHDERLTALFNAQRQAFAADLAPSHAVRDDRLKRLLAMTQTHQKAIETAISCDFGNRSRHETALAEVFVTIASVRHAQRNLKRWMRTKRVPTPFYMLPATSRIMRQPLGVVGIVSPWNYPFQLSLAPAIGAIAAGNRAMIKPSELVPNFSALLCDMVAAYFAPDEIAVVTGDATTAKSFVALPFDHLFFTGSTSVGRQVAVAAAQNLTPVTLELGGKSPAIVDADSDIADVASKLVVGKMLNAGQTCIAPDYVLIAPDSVDALVAAMRTAVASLYPTLANNPDYTSILSDRHRAHLNHLLDDARSKGAQVIEINPGNEQFASTERKMPLNLVLDAHDDMAVMQDEIFGPILPFVLAADTPAAISYVNCHPRPLALYWFGRNKTRRDQVLEQTIAGGVTVNDTVWHIGQEHLPFGGVGASGIGAYHGEAGFLAFSKEKPVLYQSKFSGIRLLRPPYGVTFRRILDALKRLA